MKDLKLFVRLWVDSDSAIKKIIISEWSGKKLFFMLLGQAMIIKIIAFIIFIINPQWTHPNTMVLGKQVLLFRPFWREALGIVVDVIKNVFLVYVFALILKIIVRVFKQKISYKRILTIITFWYSFGIILYLFVLIISLMEKGGIDVNEIGRMLLKTMVLFSLYVVVKMNNNLFQWKTWKSLLVLICSSIMSAILGFLSFVILSVII